MKNTFFKFKCHYAHVCMLLFMLMNHGVFSAVKTWTNTAGGAWTTAGNWSPNGVPTLGDDVILLPLLDNTKFISAVPQITLNSIICSGVGFSWLQASASGNTISVTSSLTIPASYSLTIGTTGARHCFRILSVCTASINGGLAFDAGNTNRAFEVYGTLVVNASGNVYDPNPSGGSDYYFFSGANLKTQKTQGFTTTSAANFAAINWNAALSVGGTYSYAPGVNYEYNGTSDQITGLGLSQTTPSNVVNNNASGQKVTLSAATKISGTLTINAVSTLSASAFSFSIGATTGAGNFVNNGTFSAGTGTVVFNGNAAQTISGASTTTFNCLTINNASGVILSTPAKVSGTLALTSGLFNVTSTNSLTLLGTAVAPALTAAATSYVNGPMTYIKNTSGSSTLNFPIGTSPDCRPMQLVVNHGNTNLYNYKGELFNASAKALAYTMPGTIDTVSNTHYWDLTRMDNSSVNQPSLDLSGTATLKLTFGANDAVKDLTTLRLVKNTYSATTTWIDLFGGATGGTTTNGNITSIGFNSFSRFTLAGNAAGINPLPITLLDFTAEPQDDLVLLNWSTLSEKNSDYFTVEKSFDGLTFEAVTTTPAAGNSSFKRSYSTLDHGANKNINYYRLKQSDFDGTVTYYKIIALAFNNLSSDLTIFPNPTKAGVITLSKLNAELSAIEIFNATGQQVYFNTGTVSSIDLTGLPGGVYYLRAVTVASSIHKKIVIEN